MNRSATSAPPTPVALRPARRPVLQSLGLTSRQVALDDRERFVRAAREIVTALRAQHPGAPILVLETCHRLEFVWVARGRRIEQRLRSELATVRPEAQLLLRHRQGVRALRHLFRVSLGLDSPVPGEREVARQLRQAWQAARERGASHPLLDRAVGAALSAAARANAADTDTAASVASDAVRQLRARSPEWDATRVVVLGAGEVARGVVRSLLERPPQSVTVSARTSRPWPAPVRVREWTACASLLHEADVLILATGADQPLVAAADLAGTSVRIVVDLALPRNAAADLRSVAGIELIDLDDVLHSRWMPDAADGARLQARERIGRVELARFRASEALRAAGPQVARLHADGARLAAEELARTLCDLDPADPRIRDGMARLASQLSRRLLYRTSRTLRELATIASR